MPRDAGLRLAQDLGEIRDGQLGLAEQRQDAQPRGLAGGLEDAVERVESHVGSGGHGVGHVPVLARWRRFSPAHKDIFIPLSGRHQGRWAGEGASRE